MAYLLWKNQYSVNVEEFDNQHRKLFNFINELDASIKKGNVYKEMKNTVLGLLDYTQEHFSYEENNMRKYDYPDLENHRAEHKKLTSAVINITSRLEKGDVEPNELIMFLMNWLVKHIMGVDKKYSVFFAEKKIS